MYDNGRSFVTLLELPVACRLRRGRRSIAAAAEESGLSSTNLSRVELGEARPSAETLLRLASWLEVDIRIMPEDLTTLGWADGQEEEADHGE
jgi:transcriptional regulator with XRE-family HTH domain